MTGMRMCGTGAALLTAVLLVVCASGAQGLSATGCAAVAPALRPARVKAAEAGGLPSAGLALWRCSQQLYLRGAGDDDEEEAAEEGGEEGGAEEDGEGDGEKEDKDEGAMTITNSIKQVLYHARIHQGVAKGLKEVVQSLERGEAQLVILAEDCDHEDYVNLISALTAEKGVYLIKVPEKAKLGDWAGQHKLDADANVKKTCPASCVAVKDFGEQSEGLAFLLQYIKSQQEVDAPAALEEDGEAAEEMEEEEAAGDEEEAAAEEAGEEEEEA